MTTPSHVDVEARSYELDPYGHVNNAVFVNWLEHGRLAFLRDRGMTYTSIPEEYGVHVVVVHQDVAFKAQVRLGEALSVESRIGRFGRSSFAFEQAIRFAEDDRPACVATVTMACVADERSVPMPAILRERLDT